MTLAIDEVKDFRRRLSPLVAQAFANYASNPRESNWGKLTIAKEMRRTFALNLCAEQAAWAAGFGLVIAWVGNWFG